MRNDFLQSLQELYSDIDNSGNEHARNRNKLTFVLFVVALFAQKNYLVKRTNSSTSKRQGVSESCLDLIHLFPCSADRPDSQTKVTAKEFKELCQEIYALYMQPVFPYNNNDKNKLKGLQFCNGLINAIKTANYDHLNDIVFPDETIEKCYKDIENRLIHHSACDSFEHRNESMDNHDKLLINKSNCKSIIKDLNSTYNALDPQDANKEKMKDIMIPVYCDSLLSVLCIAHESYFPDSVISSIRSELRPADKNKCHFFYAIFDLDTFNSNRSPALSINCIENDNIFYTLDEHNVRVKCLIRDYDEMVNKYTEYKTIRESMSSSLLSINLSQETYKKLSYFQSNTVSALYKDLLKPTNKKQLQRKTKLANPRKHSSYIDIILKMDTI